MEGVGSVGYFTRSVKRGNVHRFNHELNCIISGRLERPVVR